MTQHYRSSFLAAVLTIFIVPLFFIPGGVIDIGNAKSFAAVIGILTAATLFLVEFMRRKEVSLPRHHLLFAALLLPVVYLLSSLLSTPSSLSLLGYNMEVGTFGSILLGTAILFVIAAALSETSRALQATLALFGSLSILALFVAVKVISGGSILVLGNFTGSMGNPLGGWMDLAVAFGLLAILSMLALGMLPMKGGFKVLLYSTFFLSTALLSVIHFASALILTLIASVFIFFYFLKVESGFYFSHTKGEQGGEAEKSSWLSRPTLMPIFLGVVSLIFFVNPMLPGGHSVGDTVSGVFGISNTEIRPTLSSTLSISKAVLFQHSLLGSGPNTFTSDWLAYKPSDVNATPFWAVEFPFGAGFIATQVAATGVMGSILWLAFFVLLFSLALKVLTNIPESRSARFGVVSTLAISLFLWTAFFFYTPSLAMFLTAFAFTGILLALGRIAGFLLSRIWCFPEVPAKYVATFAVLVCLSGIAFLGWIELERTLAAFHFQHASNLSNVAGTPLPDVESELVKAVKFAPLDTYYLAISQLNFSKAQAISSSATGTPEENRANFEEALRRSIGAARAAVTANPASYGNWIALGNIYSSLVPGPLKIEGAYESAQYAYNEAFKRNPSNPGLPLFLAQLELNKGNVDNARSFIRSSIALKDNYADAYILLARLEASAKNTPAAIASAEKVATLLPDNVGAQFELGLLKYSAEDYAGAVTVLERALTLSPEYANAKYYLALSLAKLGRNDEALTKLKELLASNPNSVELQNAIKSLSGKK